MTIHYKVGGGGDTGVGFRGGWRGFEKCEFAYYTQMLTYTRLYSHAIVSLIRNNIIILNVFIRKYKSTPYQLK